MTQQHLAAAPTSGPAAPSSPQPPPAHDAPVLQVAPVQFNGVARDFFGVWFVNLLLTIVTLGIWSAWATVRTNRWFYGNTVIKSHAFEYHATPLQILKGRLIAVALIALIAAVSYVAPMLELFILVALAFAMPWAINAGLRFSACMTSWSNVRFDFHGSYWRAFGVFLLMPIAAMLTLGLLAPVHSKLLGRYLADGYRYGGFSFACAPRLSTLYRALGRTAALVIGIAAPGLLATYLMCVSAGIPFHIHSLLLAFVLGKGHIVLPSIVSVYAAVFFGGIHYGACVRNELYNRTTIQGGHRLQSRLSPMRYAWILASGFLVTAITLTLAYPWARVRQYRYLAQSVTLLAAPGLDEFISQQRHAPSSFGGEFSELEGFASASSI
ncbi:YjgN family protein [Achromobacter deleyi]|uniref:YjgN family protein n=1 Tax=Achromobacter deleyi TaxID=1353891 RepID=UPI001492943B|nr:YjgN family protein [Achromobacter deleyi]QVQ24407.1 DUF898 domain-containing protein [Achromobacter deleyi]UIP19939.1 DUF898 domain-containing protein [Achromobacter deleyi]